MAQDAKQVAGFAVAGGGRKVCCIGHLGGAEAAGLMVGECLCERRIRHVGAEFSASPPIAELRRASGQGLD
jgi:hypothetical protein